MSTSWPSCGLLIAAAAVMATSGCNLYGVYPWQVRVPVEDVGATFNVAELAWFEAEQTLFVFYEVESLQGLNDLSQIEITWRTDEDFQPFAPLHDFEPVHTHLEADCGDRKLCGSYSVFIPLRPRDLGLQLRYHRDGELTLDAGANENLILASEPFASRSAVVYGVFDEENIHVQWRLRHQFPAIRNHHAQDLGLRRYFRVDDIGYGALPGGRELFMPNVYGYGLTPSCPAGFVAHEHGLLETDARALFDPAELPIDSYTVPHVCGLATVTDALGEFTTTAFGRKNPQTRPAFGELQTPITVNEPVPFYLEVCNNPTSELHRAMIKQRLFLEGEETVCIDDFDTMDFPSRLANLLTEKIDEYRAQKGRDMVLTIGLSRARMAFLVPQRVEEALALVLPVENGLSTPRVSGAFVLDSNAYTLRNGEVSRLTLWCPANAPGDDLDQIPDTSMRSCAVQPTIPLMLGQASLSSLPILPTEPQFENFIEKYGPAQTGYMTDLAVRAPTRTAQSRSLPIGDFGVATFFNGESLTPAQGDAFSYCAEEDTGLIVVGIPGFPDVLPLSLLGEVHALLNLPRYDLGLFWDFPFLMQMNYESTLAGGADILPDEVPFVLAAGISSPQEQFLGGFQWEADSFTVGDALLLCDRYCEHPTFSSSGNYEIDDYFIDSYPSRCYRPRYPRLGDGGFPSDP